MPLIGKGLGLSTAEAFMLAAFLWVPVVALCHCLWGEHWPVGKRIWGFAFMALVVFVLALTARLQPSPKEIILYNGVENKTVNIPDKTMAKFKSSEQFAIMERQGTKPDGSYIIEEVIMPLGESQRFFVWGGNIVLKGLYNKTKLEVTF